MLVATLLINDGTAWYRSDQANRLISTTLNSTTSLFNYNGDGLRLKQTVNGVATTYAQDLAAPLPVVLQSKIATTITQYLYSTGTGPLGQYTSGAWQYLLPDALGSVRQIADASGNIIRTQDYEPYGSLLNSNGSGQSVYGFTGEERDTTGLIFLRARYMQPRLGIFLSHDPADGDVMQPGSMSGFSYAEGNPVNATDPSGQAICLPPNHWVVEYDWSEGHEEEVWKCVPWGSGSTQPPLPPGFGTTLSQNSGTNPAGVIIAGVLILGYICYEAVAQPWTQTQSRSEPRVEPTVIPIPVERVRPEPTQEPERLYAFGRSPSGSNPGPRVRPGTDIYVDIDGMVDEQYPPFPSGASTFGNLDFAPLSGHYYYIPGDWPMPPGLGVIADGKDVNPASRLERTHHTIYPTERMLFVEFERLFKSLPWTYGGSK